MSATTTSSPLYCVNARLALKRVAVAAERQAQAQREREIVQMVALDRVRAAQEKVTQAEDDSARVRPPAVPRSRPQSPWRAMLARLPGDAEPSTNTGADSSSRASGEDRVLAAARSQLTRLVHTDNPFLIEQAEALALAMERRHKDLFTTESASSSAAPSVPTEVSPPARRHDRNGVTTSKQRRESETPGEPT